MPDDPVPVPGWKPGDPNPNPNPNPNPPKPNPSKPAHDEGYDEKEKESA